MAQVYDIVSALQILMPGIVLQNSLIDAASQRYQAKGSALAASDVAGILATANTLDQSGAGYVPTVDTPYPTALPAAPTSLKRFEDSNPCSSDDWALDNETMERPGL